MPANFNMTSSILFLAQQQGGFGALIASLMPIFLVFLVFYLLIIRPQQKRQRQMMEERERMLSSLKPGDKVVTSGGIYGTIVALRGNTVQLRIAQSVSIEVRKSAIEGLQSEEGREAEAAK